MAHCEDPFYAGHEILLPDSLDVDEFASTLQEAYLKGGHLWVTLDSPGRGLPQVRLLLAQVIPVGFVMDEADGGDGVLSEEKRDQVAGLPQDPGA